MNTVSILTQAFGWALLHSLWQGLLLYVMLRSLLIGAPRASARVKHRAAYGALMALTGWFLLTFIQHWLKLQAITVRIASGNSQDANYKVSFVHTIPQGSHGMPIGLSEHLNKYIPYLLLVYCIGVCFFAIRLLFNLVQVRGLRTRDTIQPPQSLQDLFSRLQKTMEINGKVKLLMTARIHVPVVFGTLKPIILLPASILSNLTIDQLEAILIHELAHIRRYDYLLNILQAIIEVVLFFNPATWLISSIIRREREHCCDDYVLSHTAQPLPYALALTTLETIRLQTPGIAMAADGHNKYQLLNRIKRIMEMQKQQLSGTQLLAIIAVISTLVASAIWFTPAIAQNRGKNEKIVTSSVKKEKIIIIDDHGKRTEYNSTDELPKEIKEKIASSLDEVPEPRDMQNFANIGKIAKMFHEDMDTAEFKAAMTEVAKSIKEIDWTEIGRTVDSAMKSVDWDKISKDVNIALANADNITAEADIITEEADAATAKADNTIAEADAAMAKAEKALRKAFKEMKDAKKTRLSTKVMIDNTDESSDDYTDEMIDKMDRDGLINRRRGFEIETKNGTLYIDGIGQDDDVYRQYRKYLHGKKVRIKGDSHNLSVQIDN